MTQARAAAGSVLVAVALLGSQAVRADVLLRPETFRASPDSSVVVRIDDGFAHRGDLGTTAVGDGVVLYTLSQGGHVTPLEAAQAKRGTVTVSVGPLTQGHTVVAAETRVRRIQVPATRLEGLLETGKPRRALDEGRSTRAQLRTVDAVDTAKAIICSGDTESDSGYSVKRDVGLEIVPESSPCALTSADAITLRVYKEGQPFGGAPIWATLEERAGDERPATLITDKHGRAILRLLAPGRWVVRAATVVPLRRADLPEPQLLTSTLAIEVVPEGEPGPLAEADAARAKKEIRKLLEDQDSVWNRGDLAAAMQFYWKSGGLTFGGPNGVIRGWEGLLQRYRRDYPNQEAMGRVSHSDLEIHLLATNAAYVLARWSLERGGETYGGTFTFVLRKFRKVGASFTITRVSSHETAT